MTCNDCVYMSPMPVPDHLNEIWCAHHAAWCESIVCGGFKEHKTSEDSNDEIS